MTIEELGSLGELIAAVATIATLGYLAWQIRQNTNAVRGQAEMEYTHETIAFIARMTSDPALLEIWRRGVSGETMSEDDQLRYVFMNSEWFFLCEGCFRRYRRGLMADEAWFTLADGMASLLRDDVLKAWWESEASILSRDFRDYMNEYRQRGGTWQRESNTSVLFDAIRERAGQA